jgi:hypothetical protein
VWFLVKERVEVKVAVKVKGKVKGKGQMNLLNNQSGESSISNIISE